MAEEAQNSFQTLYDNRLSCFDVNLGGSFRKNRTVTNRTASQRRIPTETLN